MVTRNNFFFSFYKTDYWDNGKCCIYSFIVGNLLSQLLSIKLAYMYLSCLIMVQFGPICEF